MEVLKGYITLTGIHQQCIFIIHELGSKRWTTGGETENNITPFSTYSSLDYLNLI